jgi:hypothetical protein
MDPKASTDEGWNQATAATLPRPSEWTRQPRPRGTDPPDTVPRFSHNQAVFGGMELSGFEPLTSWVRSKSSGCAETRVQHQIRGASGACKTSRRLWSAACESASATKPG